MPDTYGLEEDGSCQIMQDESCGHILFNPPNQPDVFAWDFDPARQFPAEDDAMAWHDAHCPYPGRFRG